MDARDGSGNRADLGSHCGRNPIDRSNRADFVSHRRFLLQLGDVLGPRMGRLPIAGNQPLQHARRSRGSTHCSQVPVRQGSCLGRDAVRGRADARAGCFNLVLPGGPGRRLHRRGRDRGRCARLLQRRGRRLRLRTGHPMELGRPGRPRHARPARRVRRSRYSPGRRSWRRHDASELAGG